jgi:hypothetical protein
MTSFSRILFTQDTVLKQQPIQSSQLPNNQLQRIPVGTELVLQGYSVPASHPDHYRFTLRNMQFKGFNAWFVFGKHVQIIESAFTLVTTIDAMIAKQTEKNALRITVDKKTIGNQQGFLKIVFNVDTFIKRRPVDANVLNDQSKQTIPTGTELVLLTSAPDANNIVRLPIEDSHVKFSLKDAELKGFSSDWYVFTKHAGIIPNG